MYRHPNQCLNHLGKIGFLVQTIAATKNVLHVSTWLWLAPTKNKIGRSHFMYTAQNHYYNCDIQINLLWLSDHWCTFCNFCIFFLMWSIFTGGKNLTKPKPRPTQHAPFLSRNMAFPATLPLHSPPSERHWSPAGSNAPIPLTPRLYTTTSHSILQSQHCFRCSSTTSHSSAIPCPPLFPVCAIVILLVLVETTPASNFFAPYSRKAPKMTNPLKISCNPTSFLSQLVQNMLFIRILVRTRSQNTLDAVCNPLAWQNSPRNMPGLTPLAILQRNTLCCKFCCSAAVTAITQLHKWLFAFFPIPTASTI